MLMTGRVPPSLTSSTKSGDSVLMKLLWLLTEPLLAGFLDLLPDAPDPVDWVLPWPAWVPFWPFGVTIASVVLVGVAVIALKFLRWIYGLIPVIQ